MGKLAFLFPGQGSQAVGMGKEILTASDSAIDFFQQASEITGLNLIELCLDGPEEALRGTANQQPAIAALSIVLLHQLRERGLKPDVVAGHSLGEYSALVAAGVLSGLQAVRFVRKRGLLMEEAVKGIHGTMAAIIGLSPEITHSVCKKAEIKGIVGVANYNCPGQIVISGEEQAVSFAIQLAKEAGAKRSVLLPVSGPFHSSMMAAVGDGLREVITGDDLKSPSIPIIMNYTSDYCSSPDEIKELVIRQVSGSVRWEETLLRMAADGVSTFIEVGPGKVLSGFVKRTLDTDGLKIISISDLSDIESTLLALT